MENTIDPLPVWRRYLVYVTVALMPVVYNFEKILKTKGPRYLSPFDVLMPILFLLMLVDLLRRVPLRFKCPPLSTLFWALAALASCALVALGNAQAEGGRELGGSLSAAMNVLLVGVAAVWVFMNCAGSAAEMRRLLLILAGSVGVCTIWAVVQYAGPVGVPFDPDNPTRPLGGATNVRLGSWYGYRAVFGAQIAMLVPAAAALAFWDRRVIVRWCAGVFALVALCVTMAASGFVGACAGVLAIACASAMSRRWLTALTIFAVLLGLIAIVLPRLPRQNAAVISRGLALFADDDAGKRKPTARLRRYQAALDLLATPSNPRDDDSPPNWVKGVGIRRYQESIGKFYRADAYPKPGRQTDDEAAYDMDADERYSFGFLETVAVEMGVPGLIAVLIVFGTWIAAAQSAFARASVPGRTDALTAMLALAALGAGCGALALSFTASPLLPGIRSTLAFFIALALWANAMTIPERGETTA